MKRSGPIPRLVLLGAFGLLALVAGATAALSRYPWARQWDGLGWSIRLADTVRTGHQRVERLIFLDQGRRLAAICPRYNRLVIYQVEPAGGLRLESDIELEGRPVALAFAGGLLHVVQRPSGDARHLQEAWWDCFDHHGRRRGPQLRVGYDPDDLAILPDGRSALVLRSGSAEGEAGRPDPSILIVDLTDPLRPRPRHELPLGSATDDPERLAIAPDGSEAAIGFRDRSRLARIRLSDLEAPVLLDDAVLPRPLREPRPGYRPDGTLVAFDAARGDSAPEVPTTSAPRPIPAPPIWTDGSAAYWRTVAGRDLLLRVQPDRSGIEIHSADRLLGEISLGGWSRLRLTDLDLQRGEQGVGLLAIADRSGGVRLVRIESGAR